MRVLVLWITITVLILLGQRGRIGMGRESVQPVWTDTMQGRNVVVEVDDGRVYDCVMVGYAQRQTVVECVKR